MFEEVVVGVGDDDTGRDAVALGKELVSAHGKLTLVNVHVVSSKPAPDSGAVGDAAKRRYASERLTALAGAFSVGSDESDSVDRLVIGTHKYRPIKHLRDGGTSQRLAGRGSLGAAGPLLSPMSDRPSC
jgi:hypothetical protein